MHFKIQTLRICIICAHFYFFSIFKEISRMRGDMEEELARNVRTHMHAFMSRICVVRDYHRFSGYLVFVSMTTAREKSIRDGRTSEVLETEAERI